MNFITEQGLPEKSGDLRIPDDIKPLELRELLDKI